MNRKVSPRAIIGAAVAVLVVAVAFGALARLADHTVDLKLGEFEQKVAAGEVKEATLLDRDSVAVGTLRNGDAFRAPYPSQYTDELTRKLLDGGVDPEVDNQAEPSGRRWCSSCCPSWCCSACSSTSSRPCRVGVGA